MAHLPLILACVLLLSPVCAKITDSPPKIEKTLPAESDKPLSYFIEAKLFDGKSNELTCTASNAEKVYWEVSDTKNGPWVKLADKADDNWMKEGAIETVSDTSGTVSVKATDDLTKDKREEERRPKIKGYYRCVATNSYDYKTLSPVIWLIAPEVLGATTSEREERKKNEPAKLSCLGTTASIKPAGYNTYIPLKRSWSLVKENNQVDLRPGLVVDPVTGYLIFPQLITEDEVAGTGTGTSEYQCLVLYSNDPETTLTGRYTLDVDGEGVIAPVLLLPISEQKVNNKYQMKCIAGLDCEISCLFAGVSGNGVGKLETLDNPNTDLTFTDTDSGKIISAVTKEADGEWKCSHDEAPGKDAIIVVEVQDFPKLETGLTFGDRFVNSNIKNVRFNCLQKDKKPTDTVEFYINGVKVVTTDLTAIPRVSNSELIFNDVVNQSASIQCILTNELGSSYHDASLVVYDEPKITIDPLSYDVDASNDSSTWTFTCTMVLDPKTEINEVFWYTSRNEGEKVTVKDDEGISELVIPAPQNNKLISTLTLELHSTSSDKIPGTEWRCAIDYSIPPSTIRLTQNSSTVTQNSSTVNFNTAKTVSSSLSLVLCSTVCVLIFGGMQMFKHEISANEWLTVVGGFAGSWLFVFSLTAVNSLESTLFGEGFQAQLIPEVIVCLFMSLFLCGTVHRVCVTTCFLFSLAALYYLNILSEKTYYAAQSAPAPQQQGKKKKH